MSRSAPHHWHGGPPGPGRPVVVGVIPGRGSWVAQESAALAQAMGVALVCVWADPSRVYVADGPDGTIETTPLDPDQDDDGSPTADEAALEARLADDLAQLDVVWRFVYTVDEPARALDAVAAQYDARLIAVGPRRPGWAGWMSQMVGGSVAGRLAHTQHRPVLVVPPAPRGSA